MPGNLVPTLGTSSVGAVGSNVSGMLQHLSPFITMILGVVFAFFIGNYLIGMITRVVIERREESEAIDESEHDLLAYMVAQGGKLPSDFGSTFASGVKKRMNVLNVSKGTAMRQQLTVMSKTKEPAADLSTDPYVVAREIRESL